MRRSWLEIAGTRFASAVRATIQEVADAIDSTDSGDEDTQCQQLFSELFTTFRNRQPELSGYLVADSAIENLVVEFRYYRSRRQRNHRDDRVQFVEQETGADFALAQLVYLEDIAVVQRHVLGQAKLIEGTRIRIDRTQIATLRQAAGGELGVYALWGSGNSPRVVTIANVKGVINATSGPVTIDRVDRFTRPLADYIVDDFLGLWHGVDFHPEEYPKEDAPAESPAVLFHFLHGGTPPRNTAYFGMYRTMKFGQMPGFHVYGRYWPDGQMM